MLNGALFLTLFFAGMLTSFMIDSTILCNAVYDGSLTEFVLF